MQIGSVYNVTEHYNSWHDMGLYIVTKAGKKFWTLKKIKSSPLGEMKMYLGPADSSHTGKCIAIKPIVHCAGRNSLLVSFDNYDPKEDSACVDRAGSGCYRTFNRVLPDKNNDYVYGSTSQHYG